ncbi:hypothetical protein V5F38_11555 [Xanthobacter sp. V0B-10]
MTLTTSRLPRTFRGGTPLIFVGAHHTHLDAERHPRHGVSDAQSGL